MWLLPAQSTSRRRRRPRARTLAFAVCAALALGSLMLLLCGGVAAAGGVKGQQVGGREEASSGSKGEMVFVPTREWQVIPEGAAIPPVSDERVSFT